MTNTTTYSRTWQRAVPDIAWGTLLLFAVVVVGYGVVIYSVFTAQINDVLACVICSWLTYASFTVVHDAGHGSIFVSTSQYKKFESVIGWIASVPLVVSSFRFFKIMHDRHHAHTNDPDRDPDYINTNHPLWLIVRIFSIPLQYYVRCFTVYKDDPVCRASYRSTVIYLLLVHGSLAGLVLAGFVKEVIILAYVPTLVALFVLVFFFDYLPHHPHTSVDTFHNTRVYPSRVINWLLLGQNYHLVHHLYPKVPWYRYQTAFELVREDLVAQQSPIESPRQLLGRQSLSHNNIGALLDLDKGFKIGGVLKVKSIKPLCTDAVAISFVVDCPIEFVAGQYITIGKWLDGQYHSRCYSICSQPREHQLTIAVRRVDGGVMSYFLTQQLNVGDELIVKGPFGEFTFVPADEPHQLVLVAGGSGITPILSILKTALQANYKVQLLYFNRNYQSSMFADSLNQLQQRYSQRFNFIHYWSEDQGRVDRAKLQRLIPVMAGDYYLCGPQGLTEMVVDYLRQQQVANQMIHTELFTRHTEPSQQGEVYEIELAGFGKGQSFKACEHQNIVEAALAQHIAIDHACMNGTCGSCKCQLVKGQVETLSDGLSSLSEQDQAEGFILACQSKPRSDLRIV